ncbi:tetratricopeptide repeat protein [Thermopirellula anaerolimosa]
MRSLKPMARRLLAAVFSSLAVVLFSPFVLCQEPGDSSNKDDVGVPSWGTAASDTQPPLESPAGPTLTLRTEGSQSESAQSADPAAKTAVSGESGPGESVSGDGRSSTLEPAVDPVTNTEVTVDPAAFNGITPGVSTMEDVRKAWGEPTARAEQDGDLLHLYAVGPFNRVETHFRDGKVSGIVIHLEKAYPANLVAEHLQLANVRPVLVSDPQGMVIGQAFPEKGVLFSFAPAGEAGKASMLVTQIVLDPISAEPFVLRAETFLENDPESAEKDLRVALRLDPGHARAHWLLARSYMLLQAPGTGLAAAQQAVALAPNDPQFRLTLAQLLAAAGSREAALRELQTVAAAAENRPHIKARAVCALGDLSANAEPPDYKKAVEYYTEAIKIAHPIASDPHPAYRLAAKEVLVDAHIGAARAIAWGPWEQKEIVVPRWLDRAGTAADALAKEGGSPLFRIRVAAAALSASVGVPSGLDPQPWIARLEEAAPSALAEAGGVRRLQIQWDIGVALYDAVQCFQIRGDHDSALRYGLEAAELLENGQESRTLQQSDYYLMGRLYFRLGAIHAIAKQDHDSAVKLFDKAVPMLQKAATGTTGLSAGRLGETFVSMGVSYWESNQAAKAIELTEQGIKLLETAVQSGAMDATALEVPHSNLAAMRRQARTASATTSSPEGEAPSIPR